MSINPAPHTIGLHSSKEVLNANWAQVAALTNVTEALPSGSVVGNASASVGAATSTTLTALFDRVFASTQGATLSRGASGWQGEVRTIYAEDYGVVGDGTTINTTNVQLAETARYALVAVLRLKGG